jgi:hypothetical protein
MEHDMQSDQSESKSVLFDEEQSFDNMFATKEAEHKLGTSKGHKRHTHRDTLPHHALPKMQFPTFDGSQPKIWIDKCLNYFNIYKIPNNLQVEAATMHLQDNAA